MSSAVINAMDFGAKGNGISDNSPALQAAILGAHRLNKDVVIPSENIFFVLPTEFCSDDFYTVYDRYLHQVQKILTTELCCDIVFSNYKSCERNQVGC